METCVGWWVDPARITLTSCQRFDFLLVLAALQPLRPQKVFREYRMPRVNLLCCYMSRLCTSLDFAQSSLNSACALSVLL